MNIIITANSPGEISGWAQPLIKEIKKNIPDVKIYLVLLPCVFSSGKEKEVAEKIEGIEKIFPPQKIWSLIFGRSKFLNHGVIIHLGGDLLYAALLAVKTKYKAYSYIWANPLWDKYFTGYFVRHEKDRMRLLKQKISSEKISIVGDFIYDAMKTFKKETKHKDLTLICLPGSRKEEFTMFVPMFMGVAELLKQKIKNINFNIIVSPYLDNTGIFSNDFLLPDIKLKGVKAYIDKDENLLRSESGTIVKLIKENHYQEMARAHFAVCIPGTKTAQLAALGIPMLVVLPLNRAELVPFTGLVGMIDYLGIFGKKLKYHLIRKAAKNFGATAQPNLLAARYVVPEMIQDLTVEEIYLKVESLLANPNELAKMSAELENIYRQYEGAFGKVINILSQNQNIK